MGLAESPKLASEEVIRRYCDEFISKHKAILRPDLNYDILAIVSKKEGSLLFIEFKEGKRQLKYELTDEPIGKVLMLLPQKAFGGDLTGVRFAGTNIVREGNKLILIKGDNSSKAWSQMEAKKDAFREIIDIRNMITHGRK
jgi:hypothetical protein